MYENKYIRLIIVIFCSDILHLKVEEQAYVNAGIIKTKDSTIINVYTTLCGIEVRRKLVYPVILTRRANLHFVQFRYFSLCHKKEK